jgi:hypothetical protein
MYDEGDPLVQIQGLEQGIQVAAVLDEAIGAGATVRQLVGVAHADKVGGDAAASWLQVRQHVAPEVRRGGIAVQQHDGVARSHVHVRHLATEDPPPLLLVGECRRDHVGFSFLICSAIDSRANGVPDEGRPVRVGAEAIKGCGFGGWPGEEPGERVP